jgi:hypothetical protein
LGDCGIQEATATYDEAGTRRRIGLLFSLVCFSFAHFNYRSRRLLLCRTRLSLPRHLGALVATGAPPQRLDPGTSSPESHRARQIPSFIRVWVQIPTLAPIFNITHLLHRFLTFYAELIWKKLSGTIIRGTPKTPKIGW